MSLIIKILGDRPVAYHPVLARISGGVKAGIMLSQLCYWFGKGADPDGWIFKTEKEFEEETALTIREQEGARKLLVKCGFVEIRRMGMPAKLHFKLNQATIEGAIEIYLGRTSSAESAEPVTRKAQNQLRGNGTILYSENTTEITTEIRSRPSDSPPSGEDEPNSGKFAPEDLVEGWNEICVPQGLPKVLELSPTRRTKTLLRLKEHPLEEWWEIVINNIANSPFCRGLRPSKDGRRWKAHFDWLIENDTNAVKAFEGRYDA